MEELKTESKVTKFLYSFGELDENVKGMLPYFQFRDDFYKGYDTYSKSETDFSSRIILTVEGKKVGIAMLNSAWGCTSKSGEDVLLGSAQVEEESLKYIWTLMKFCSIRNIQNLSNILESHFSGSPIHLMRYVYQITSQSGLNASNGLCGEM